MKQILINDLVAGVTELQLNEWTGDTEQTKMNSGPDSTKAYGDH